MKTKLTAQRAKRICTNAKEPDTIEGILRQVSAMSKMGFSNVSVFVPNKQFKRVKKIVGELKDLGYEASVQDTSVSTHLLISVSWS